MGAPATMLITRLSAPIPDRISGRIFGSVCGLTLRTVMVPARAAARLSVVVRMP